MTAYLSREYTPNEVINSLDYDEMDILYQDDGPYPEGAEISEADLEIIRKELGDDWQEMEKRGDSPR